MLADSQVFPIQQHPREENNSICLLTSNDIRAHNHPQMEQPPKTQGSNRVAYPLRFRSKAQKKRLEDAAKQSHKTLKDFLIDLGEQAAASMQREEQVT